MGACFIGSERRKSIMDYTAIITAVIAFAGTLIGTLAGISRSTTLTTYKIDELTKKVNEHNNLIKRTYDLEARADLADAELYRVNHRLENLEEGKK